jgi:hypothetical protein
MPIGLSNSDNLLFSLSGFILLHPLQLAVAGLLSVALAASAAPDLPSSDVQVLERLPTRATDPVARELRALRAEHSANPANSIVAGQLARHYFDLAMAEGDPDSRAQ